MAKKRKYFEEVSLDVVRKIAGEQTAFSAIRMLCAICHQPVDIECVKTDENGQAVHGKCYFTKVSLAEVGQT